jgi:quercetin 2,3-dioxygenase
MSRLQIHRSGDRFWTRTSWLDSRHSFSFGVHYDPANTGFGPLVVSNDDLVSPGTGFETHPHRDMEIVTWVLEGALVHQDSTGNSGVIYPGLAQRMTAGSGILHSEKNDSWRLTQDQPHSEPVRFVQMWVLPDDNGLEPGYQQQEIPAQELSAGLVVVASGMPQHRDQAAIMIRQSHAALHAARLAPAQTVQLPAAPRVHIYVARGTVELEGAGALASGDAVRGTETDGQRLTAVGGPAEVLVWELTGPIR